MPSPASMLTHTHRLILLSLLVGAGAGLVAELFLRLIDLSQHLLLSGMSGLSLSSTAEVAAASPIVQVDDRGLWWIPLVTGLGGLIAGWLVYRFAPEAEGHGTDAVIEAYHQKDGVIRGRVPIIKLAASAIVLGSGGVAGREGPVAQVGAGIGSILARWFGLSEKDVRILLLVGTAAGLAAVFRSPLGASLFAIKILYSRLSMETEEMGYCVVGAVTAYAVIGWFENWNPLFLMPSDLVLISPLELLWYVPLGIGAGVISALLPSLFYRVRDAFHRLPVPKFMRPAIGGLILGLIAMGLPEILGGGYGVIQSAIDGKLSLYLILMLVLLKPLAMALTIGSGGSGGVFAPTLTIGALFGALLGGFMDHANPAHSAALSVVGMGAVFAGAARAPLPALVMVIEMTGGYHLVAPTMIAVILSVMVQMGLTRNARYPSLYESQVPTPADSPVHQHEYCSRVFDRVLKGLEHLEPQLVEKEVAALLLAGREIPLVGDSVLLTTLPSTDMPTNSELQIHPTGIEILGILHDGQFVSPITMRDVQPEDRFLILAHGHDALERAQNSRRPTSN